MDNKNLGAVRLMVLIVVAASFALPLRSIAADIPDLLRRYALVTAIEDGGCVSVVELQTTGIASQCWVRLVQRPVVQDKVNDITAAAPEHVLLWAASIAVEDDGVRIDLGEIRDSLRIRQLADLGRDCFIGRIEARKDGQFRGFCRYAMVFTTAAKRPMVDIPSADLKLEPKGTRLNN